MLKVSRIVCIAALILFICNTVFSSSLVPTQGYEGVAFFPEDSDEITAVYRFIYRYPGIESQYESDDAINEFFDYQFNDALAFTAPLFAMEAEENSGSYTRVDYQITCNDAVFFSTLFSCEHFFGASSGNFWMAYSFLRQGEGAGMVLSLADILGLTSPNEDDGLAYERMTRQSNELIYDLIWEIILEQLYVAGYDYYEGLTREDLVAEFYPENDFYIDQNHTLVFFIQPTMIASAASGMLLFPFSIDELLSEL